MENLNVKQLVRDIDGNLKTKLDPIRAKTSYSVAATNFSGGTGVQIMANASGYGLYLDRISIVENSSNAGVVTIYDGTVAAGTAIFQRSIASAGTIDLTELGTKKASSASGIYLIVTNSTSLDVHASFYKDAGVLE
jgi:hypothetical protein